MKNQKFNKINPILYSIFPTPVYIDNLNRSLTNEELSFVKKSKSNVRKNEGNITSFDNYILNHKEFKNLKKELNLRVIDYFDKVISSSNKITPYITQSWLNYTEINQFHHKHSHTNSLVSGVFYINCDEKFDKIKFFNNKYNVIFTNNKNFNLWNSDSWWFSVKTGYIILFPSSLPHMVETKQGDNTRISLAFNVFIKGTIGENEDLNELIIK
jgi:uncharacterized protein (TIGR02466 family)